jgi:hypothetical protein
MWTFPSIHPTYFYEVVLMDRDNSTLLPAEAKFGLILSTFFYYFEVPAGFVNKR